MSKGSKQRPRQVSEEEMERRWKQTFGKPPRQHNNSRHIPSDSEGDN